MPPMRVSLTLHLWALCAPCGDTQITHLPAQNFRGFAHSGKAGALPSFPPFPCHLPHTALSLLTPGPATSPPVLQPERDLRSVASLTLLTWTFQGGTLGAQQPPN